MQINQCHGSYNKSERPCSIEYLCIHYTGGTGSAYNNCMYFAGGDRQASADYFVDDDGIWEYNDPSGGYYTWAVGDGGGKYGVTNRNSIHVEVVNAGGAFSEAEIGHLRELVPYLMDKYGIDSDHVVRHYDASRKSCPAYYVDADRWAALKAEITTGAEKQEESGLPDGMEESGMQCIIQPNGESRLVYFDGQQTHDLTHSDQVTALDQAYQACFGKSIPCFAMGSADSPWFTRLAEALQ